MTNPEVADLMKREEAWHKSRQRSPAMAKCEEDVRCAVATVRSGMWVGEDLLVYAFEMMSREMAREEIAKAKRRRRRK